VQTKTVIDQRLRSHRLRTVPAPHRDDEDRRMTSHRLAAAGFGAFVGFWVARALFKWILDVHGTAYLALAASFVIAGAVLAIAADLDDERNSSGPPSA
jgi:hypothetical protein